MISANEVEAFKQEGFLHLKKVFSADEISRISQVGQSRPAMENAATSLMLIPEMSGLLSDERILSIAHKILGHPVSFFFEANYVNYRFVSGTRHDGHLHHDGKGSSDHLFNRLHDEFKVAYPVLRFGIYLQDTACQSGGLKLCPGSHLQETSTFEGKKYTFYDVPSEPGDVVCFCLRLLHSPFALRRKDSPEIALAPWEENALFPGQRDAFLPMPERRESIFIDFAAIDPLTDIHIKGRALHPSNAKPGLAKFLCGEGLEAFTSIDGLDLRFDYAIVDTLKEIKRHIIGSNLQAEALPYLDLLMSLCRMNSEYSQYFPFAPVVSKGSHTVNDAIAVFDLLMTRYAEYSRLLQTTHRDLHMRAGYAPDQIAAAGSVERKFVDSPNRHESERP